MGLALAGEGASVAFAARSRDKLDAAVAGVRGRPAIALPCDVRDEASCRAVVAATVDAFGGLDALVYSAGMGAFRELADATADDWRTVLDTNVVGAALVTAAAVEHLRATSGHAIYLSSESALHHTPWRGIGIYIASKRALDSMVRSFALEVDDVHFTTYVVGSTGGTEFLDAGADRRDHPVPHRVVRAGPGERHARTRDPRQGTGRHPHHRRLGADDLGPGAGLAVAAVA